MRLTLNYSVYTVISACAHPRDTGTFIYSLTRIYFLQLKIHNIWMKFFLNKKIFHLGIKEILTLKSHIKLFLIKLSADINDNSFLLDLPKASVFPNFSACNSFLLFNRFWNVRFSDRSHFIGEVFLLEKRHYSYFQLKIRAFDKY